MSAKGKKTSEPKNVKPSIPIPDFLKDAIGARLDDPEAREALPTLYEALVPKYDGSAQQTLPGKLSITVVGASWLVKLDMPTYVLQASVACASLLECLRAMDTYLSTGGALMPGFAKNKKRLPTIDDVI